MFPLLPVTNNPHYRCGVLSPGKLCFSDSIHMTYGSKACRLHDAIRFVSYCKPATQWGLQQQNIVAVSHPALWLCANAMSGCIHWRWIYHRSLCCWLLRHSSTALTLLEGTVTVSIPFGCCRLHQRSLELVLLHCPCLGFGINREWVNTREKLDCICACKYFCENCEHLLCVQEECCF